MSAWAATLGALLGAVLLVRAGYWCGRRHRACVLPPALLQELSVHKERCLGEPPERVALELELVFGATAARAARAMVAPVVAKHDGRGSRRPVPCR